MLPLQPFSTLTLHPLWVVWTVGLGLLLLEFFLLFSHSFDSFTLPFLLISLQTLWKVDTILFCLLILRGLGDSQGRVWRCHPTQLYAIEVTLLEQQQQQPQQVFRLQICICDFDSVPTTVVMQKNIGMRYSLNVHQNEGSRFFLQFLHDKLCKIPEQATHVM